MFLVCIFGKTTRSTEQATLRELFNSSSINWYSSSLGTSNTHLEIEVC